MYLWSVIAAIETYALLALGLNIITGYAGQSMMGIAAFYGIGAYSASIMTNAGMSFWLAVPCATLITAACGAVMGVIALRLKDDFLAVTTIGINFVMVALFNNLKIFGASLGLSNNGAYFFGTKMNHMHYAILMFILIVILILLIIKMNKSWFGLALASLKDDEGAARSFGIDVSLYKILTFIIGTSIAGMAGAIFAHRQGIVFSTNFAFTFSIMILSMVVIGGIGTIRGPILGAVLLGMLPEVLRFADNYRMLVYCLLLIFMVRFQPQGLIGEESFLQRQWRKLRGKGDDSPRLAANSEGKEGTANG